MLNNKQFTAKLNGVIKSAKSMRESVQVLIESGLEQYGEHGDTGQLSRLIQACVGVRSLPTNVIRDYIKAHANVMFTKAKDGSYVFKKAAGEKETTTVAITATWYDWEGNGNAAPKTDFDVEKRIQMLIKSTTKALEEGKVKEGQESEASLLVAKLQEVLAGAKADHADH